jgi:ubiquinone/menaquinone biosynthesis C-methylase UbiE
MVERAHVEAPRRVFDATADDYVRFVGTEVGEATEAAIDRSVLYAFAESLASSHVPGNVADLGCGPGRVAALLARHDLDVIGIDISQALLAIARRSHPHIPFEEGSLDDLPFADAELAGAVCWYSIIYTPPALLAGAFAEIARVVAVSGLLLVAFQCGSGEGEVRPHAYGSGVELTSYRHDVHAVAEQLHAAGFTVNTTTVRMPTLAHEQSPQAFMIARRT